MNCSPNSADSEQAPQPTVLVADGGVQMPRNPSPDPFAALDDLMVVVEALCPRWPEREGFGPMHDLRL